MQDGLAEQKAFDERRRRELAAFNRRERDRLDAICGKRSVMDVNLQADGQAAEGEIVVVLECTEGHRTTITTNLGEHWARQWAALMDGAGLGYPEDSTWIGICQYGRKAPIDSGPAASLVELKAQGGCGARFTARLQRPDGTPLR